MQIRDTPPHLALSNTQALASSGLQIEIKSRTKPGEEAGGLAAGGGGAEAVPKVLHGFVKTLKLPGGGTIRYFMPLPAASGRFLLGRR